MRPLFFDIIGLVAHDGRWSHVSEYMIGAGIIGGLLAAVFGSIDWLAIPSGTRAKAIGLWHGAGNVVVTLLFIVSWFVRYPAPADPHASAIVLSAAAVILALITGWLGGELVDRLAVGVDDNANLDAPSSLSTRHVPARRVA